MSESEVVYLQDAEERAARAIHAVVCETTFEECTAEWYGTCRNAAQRAAQVLIPFGHRAGYLTGSKAAENAVSKADETDDKACGCYTCVDAALSLLPFPESICFPFIVCPSCGNKRCPKATHHDNGCTRSNEPGQARSRFTPTALHGQNTEGETR